MSLFAAFGCWPPFHSNSSRRLLLWLITRQVPVSRAFIMMYRHNYTNIFIIGNRVLEISAKTSPYSEIYITNCHILTNLVNLKKPNSVGCSPDGAMEGWTVGRCPQYVHKYYQQTHFDQIIEARYYSVLEGSSPFYGGIVQRRTHVRSKNFS